MNKRKGCLAATLSVIVLAPLALYFAAESRGERRLRLELDLARKQGIPTTFEEYRAQLPSVSKADNAGPFYRRLEPTLRNYFNAASVGFEIAMKPTPARLAAGQKILRDHADSLALIEEIVKRPGCRAETFVSASTSPNSVYARHAADLLLLKGDMEARDSPEKALDEIRKVRVIIGHLKAEPAALTEYGATSIRIKIARRLVNWCYAYPRRKIYLDELRKVVDTWPPTDFRAWHRLDLVEYRENIALSKTAVGRRQLGANGASDPNWIQRLLALSQSQADAEADVIHGFRLVDSALDLPLDQRAKATEKGLIQILGGLAHFPAAFNLYMKFSLFDENEDVETLKRGEVRRACYKAALRALEMPRLPRALDLKDLVSPYTGKPLRYVYDGQGFVIYGDVSIGKTINLAVSPKGLK